MSRGSLTEGQCQRNQSTIAEVTHVAKDCSAGHKVGAMFEINTHKTGGICGYCYHDLFPTLMHCCYGGKIPWVDPAEFKYECPTGGMT